jgi:hypothetical protein
MNDTNLPERIPLFPLPNAILFPGLSLPLHIFEPRYREMAADARAGDGMIGMVLLNPADTASESGDPAIFPIGCAGTIDRFELLEDGRSNLILKGFRRFRIQTEDSSRAYRIAQVEWLDSTADDQSLAEIPTELIPKLEKLLRREGRNFEGSLADHLPEDATVAINTLAFAMDLNMVEKMALLECSSARLRADRLMEFVEFRLAGPDQASPDEERIVH